jgi:anti-sigma-K factor RskA
MNRIDELIALAALGELDDAERAELDRAAATDPHVAAALRDALDVAARLQTDTPVAPPAHLRVRILDEVARTPQLDADPVEEVAPSETGAATADVVGARPSAPVVPLVRRARGGWLAAAAAVVLLVAGIGVVLTSGGDGPGSENDPVAAVVDAPDAVTRPFSGMLGGDLQVVHSPSLGAIVVVADGLDPVDVDRTLQLWLVDDVAATSIGTFVPDTSGVVRVRFDDVDPTGIVLGVTLEPSGGSDAPTLPILAAASA